MKYNILAILIIILLSSCAKSTLVVTVDIFTGNLPEVQSNDDEIDNIIGKVIELESVSEQVYTDKLRLSEAIFKTYIAYYKFAAEAMDGSYDPAFTEPLNGLKSDFEDKVKNQKNSIDSGFDTIKSLLTDLINSEGDFQVYQNLKLTLPAKINQQIASIEQLADFTHVYIESIRGSFSQDLQDLSNLKNENIQESTFNEVKLALSNLATLLNNRDFNVDSRILSEMLESLESQNLTSFKDSFTKLSSVFAEIPNTLTLESRTNDLAKFIQDKNFLFNQLDRLQDFGHVDWKNIAMKMDDPNSWKREFTSTEFEAEGNSSVVLVRDSPVSFRPQQVNNDPSALIQSQLQISRAATGMALSVAGAVAGIDLESSPNIDLSTAEVSSTNEGQKAALERRMELREIALNNLIKNLQNIEEDLNNNGGVAADRAAILGRIEILTKAYILQFQ
ncbi:hypothetical protein [Ekhidna sp.]|uniref:hypothetical protein n=1 Tax=Ekhidna sp. TaxID=2608089 RepID=UPI003BAA725F